MQDSRTVRAYRALLHLYPRSFRDGYAADMLAFVRSRANSADSAPRILLLWLELALDLLRTVPRARLEAFSDRTRGQQPSVLDRAEDVRRYPEEEIVDVILHDLRYAARTLRMRPGFTTVAVLTLALGIGATTAIFSAVSAVLLRPLPYPDADRIVMLWAAQSGRKSEPVLANYADVMDWRARARSFERIGVMRGMSVNLTGGETPERLSGMFATPETFTVLGAKPGMGRLFTADEADPKTGIPVAVLSNDLWRNRYGSDPKILDRTLILNGRAHQVIGVLGPEFQPPMGMLDVWLPISSIPSRATFERGNPNVWAVGQLRRGVAPDAAGRELSSIADALAAEYPNTNKGVGALAIPLRDQIVGPMRVSLLTIFGAVGLLLLIACANVANLQLARAASRRSEIALRAALGAARGRIIRQLLTESLLLALIGGVLGVLLSRWAVTALVALVPGGLPAIGDVGIDGTVLGFAVLASVVSALVFGLVPALRASRNLRGSMSNRSGGQPQGGGRSLDSTSWITSAQLALCTTLLIVAGLLARSLSQLQAVSPGFDPSHVLYAEFRLPPGKYASDTSRVVFLERLLQQLRAVPGAQSAALVSSMPMSGNFGTGTYEVADRPTSPNDVRPRTYTGSATEGFLRTLGIPLLTGRDFAPTDRLESPRVVLVNQTFARREWPNESAVGKRVRLTGDSLWSTVIGVVGDVKELGLAETGEAHIYSARLQTPGIFSSIALRVAGDPAASTSALRSAIWAVDRDQPVWRIRPLSTFVENSTQRQRFTVLLIVSFAALALVLGAIGVYGVMSYSVAQRTREVGLRLALGAPRGQVLRLVVGRALKIAVAAVVMGVVVASLLAGALSTQLYAVAPRDPLTFSVVPLVLLSVAFVAAYLPARRASRVDPMVALRAE